VHHGNAAARLIAPGTPAPAGSTLRYGIENRGQVPLTFGICGMLERHESGGWSAVNSTTACIEIAEVVRPGQSDPRCCTVSVPADAGSGGYRLTHMVSANGSSLTLTAPIRVAAE
jgi:uncharacterized membrane protein